MQVAGELEVKAQIKLRINTATQQPVVIIRSFQVLPVTISPSPTPSPVTTACETCMYQSYEHTLPDLAVISVPV